MAQIFHVDLDENEVKLLLVAIRQVKHTFLIADQQSQAAGEPLAVDYAPLAEMYQRLHEKLAAFIPGQGPFGPVRVK